MCDSSPRNVSETENLTAAMSTPVKKRKEEENPTLMGEKVTVVTG